MKAFAAIFIVLHHYQQYTGNYYEDSFNFFPLMDSQLHVSYLTILYFMISGFFAESQELREDARGQFKSLPGKFWHKCLRIYPVAIVACGRRWALDDILQHYTERLYGDLGACRAPTALWRCSWSLWNCWPSRCICLWKSRWLST